MSPRNLMLGLTGVLAVSQFMPYADGPTVHFTYGTALPTTSTFELQGHQSGWSQHPWAFFLLVTLAVIFLTGINTGPAWRQWGYWLLIPMVWGCVAPADIRHNGGVIGSLAFSPRSTWCTCTGKPPKPLAPDIPLRASIRAVSIRRANTRRPSIRAVSIPADHPRPAPRSRAGRKLEVI